MKIGVYDHEVGGEVVIRDMTEEEIAEHEELQAQFAAEQTLETEKIAAKSALLNRLGITEDEAKLLLS